MFAAITFLYFSSCEFYLLKTGKRKTEERSKRKKNNYIVKALKDTRHPLVGDNMLHNVLLQNIINILLVDLENVRGRIW